MWVKGWLVDSIIFGFVGVDGVDGFVLLGGDDGIWGIKGGEVGGNVVNVNIGGFGYGCGEGGWGLWGISGRGLVSLYFVSGVIERDIFVFKERVRIFIVVFVVVGIVVVIVLYFV